MDVQSIIPEPVDADVPAWWRGLGLPGLADVHVHFLPERMERRVWHHFENGGPLMGAGWPIHYRMPVEERVAHLGMPEYEEFFGMAETFANVRLDTTMTFTDFAERRMPFPARLGPRLRDLGLAGKVLLGSDFPNIPHPYAHQIHALDRLGLGEDWLRAVCWDSAADLLGLSPDDTRSPGER